MTRVRSRPTIHDVARKAGVSATTVSHTFSGHGTVAAATREHVRAVAHQLGYRPDVLASGLRKSRLGVLALVLRSLGEKTIELNSEIDYFFRFAGTAGLTALEHDYAVILVADPTEPGAPGTALACDGFLLIDPLEDDPLLRFLEESGIPAITAGAAPNMETSVPSVDNWTEQICEEVLTDLAGAGARHIGVLLGTDRNEWNLGTERVCERAMRRGLRMTLRAQPEASGVAGGVFAAQAMFEQSPDIDAIYVLTGLHAMGTLQVAKERGLRIPEQLQIICGSDLEAMRSADPPVSSVDLHAELLAQTSVEQLIALLNPELPTPIVREPATFIRHRASTRPRASATH